MKQELNHYYEYENDLLKTPMSLIGFKKLIFLKKKINHKQLEKLMEYYAEYIDKFKKNDFDNFWLRVFDYFIPQS